MIVEGRTVILDRYSVGGIVWGRETLWCDETGRLAALVTVDAEFDHFEAARPEFKPPDSSACGTRGLGRYGGDGGYRGGGDVRSPAVNSRLSAPPSST